MTYSSVRYSYKRRLVLGLCLLTAGAIGTAGHAIAREVRVGVYPNEPKIFIDTKGQAAGIFPDLLREIAQQEKWSLKFVSCEWQRCLEMVESGELDLMPDVAQSDARLARFDFHKTPALNSWSELYRNPKVKIQSFLDLENKSIAVLKDSVQQSYLRDALNGFGVNTRLIPVDSFEEGFVKARAGDVDAVATNHHFGRYNLTKYNLAETTIIFLPSRLYLATKKGANGDLLTVVDYHFNQWREDAQSPLFRVLKKWAGEDRVEVIPLVVWWSLGGLSLLAILMFGISGYLRREVRKRTAEIQASEQKLDSILSNIQSAIYIKDLRLRYQYANRLTCFIYGREEKELIGKLDSELRDPKEAAPLMEHDRYVLETGQRFSGEEIVRMPGSEEPHTFFTVKIPLTNSKGEVYGLCGISTDISDQLEFSKKLDQLSHYDPLTGLFNRSFFFAEAERLLTESDRPIGVAGLILINLDNFRILNDTQGHHTGDLLLKSVADQLRAFEAGRLLARLVGDSFVFLLPILPKTPAEIRRELDELIQQIQSTVSRPRDLNGLNYHGSASIGIAIFDPHMFSVHDGFQQAELALYQAKSTERGSVQIFERQMQELAAARSKLEYELREAIEAKQLEVFYQPVVNKSGVQLGFEALIRWHHPRDGLYGPATFIPLAESTGQILPIGRFVLETVCAQLSEWSKNAKTEPLVIAVNVSAREFFDEKFIDRVIDAISHFKINPRRLELELTESHLLKDIEQTVVKLSALKGMGVRLSIDDFGTGYSSLSRLRQLPFDQLKIDASFVRDLVTNQNNAAIVKTIIDLGRTLKMEVLAEGVETLAQMDALAALGCNKFQGYLHGRPVPINELQVHSPSSAQA